MDNLTHTLVAFTLAQTSLRRLGYGTTGALVLASNAPDVDIVATLMGGGVSYLAAHRGPTHGPVGLAGLALAVAAVVRIARWPYVSASSSPPPARSDSAPGRASFGGLIGVSALGLVLHVLMDLPTSYGTRLLSPFNTSWFVIDWLPIVDVYLLIVLAVGLALLRLRPSARGRIVTGVVLLVVLDYALRASAHRLALARAVMESGHGAARSPCSLPASLQIYSRRTDTRTNDRCESPAALPTFFSPFRWRVVRRTAAGYEISEIDILRDLTATSGSPPATVSYPDHQDRWVATASETRTARVFLDFARFPAARVTHDADGYTTVRWHDMRFVGGIGRLRPPADRVSGPFVVIVRLDPEGRVIDERLER